MNFCSSQYWCSLTWVFSHGLEFATNLSRCRRLHKQRMRINDYWRRKRVLRWKTNEKLEKSDTIQNENKIPNFVHIQHVFNIFLFHSWENYRRKFKRSFLSQLEHFLSWKMCTSSNVGLSKRAFLISLSLNRLWEVNRIRQKVIKWVWLNSSVF